jgi:hypothetical protein
MSSHKGNAYKNLTDSSSPLLEYPSSKTSPTTCVEENVGKKEPWYSAGGNASCCNHCGKNLEAS